MMTNLSSRPYSTHKQDSHGPHAFHALALMGVLIVFGVIFALGFREGKEVSEAENRRLASWPVFSVDALRDGRYTREIETYVADHFPARAWFTEAAFAIRSYRGIQLGDRVIQVKGAETGFEDVSMWAGSREESHQEPDSNSTSESTASESLASNNESSDSANRESLTKDLVTKQVASVEPVIDAANAPTPEPEPSPKVELSPEPSPTSEPPTASAPAAAQIAAPMPAPAPSPTPSPVQIPAPEQTPVIVQTPPSVPAPDAVQTPPASSPPKAPTAKPASTAAAKPPQAATPSQPPPPPRQATNKPLNVVGGVLLHEGQALFMFQGTDRGAQGYANAVNTWVEQVARSRPGMTSTVVVTPTSSHFYLPPAARARTTSEAKNLAAMKAALLPEVRFADVIAEMEGNQDQPLFYKSDHHWTGLGAYYAYRAWARAAGVTPLELSAFDKRSVPGVAGSFWSLTQAPELRLADKESFYYVPKTVTFDGTQYAGPQQKTPIPQPFFAERSRGYIVFLGGDIPLLVSNTNAGTGRTALVVKNSYGNAFAPYLLPHFDRVVVLDYRYVFRNIQDIVESFGVTDLIFVNATITANSGAHQERMRQVARGSKTAWLTEAEKRRIKQEQDAAKAKGEAEAQGAATGSN
jgi:outer membrane biosynthesis protein TonB